MTSERDPYMSNVTYKRNTCERRMKREARALDNRTVNVTSKRDPYMSKVTCKKRPAREG